MRHFEFRFSLSIFQSFLESSVPGGAVPVCEVVVVSDIADATEGTR